MAILIKNKITLPEMQIDGDELGFTLALALRSAYEADDDSAEIVTRVILQIAPSLSYWGLEAINREISDYIRWKKEDKNDIR